MAEPLFLPVETLLLAAVSLLREIRPRHAAAKEIQRKVGEMNSPRVDAEPLTVNCSAAPNFKVLCYRLQSS